MSRKKRIDDLMEAITFAEAGELDTARGIASEIFPDPAAAGERILAVSGARGFSRGMLPLELEEGLLAGALGQLAAATTAGSRIAPLAIPRRALAGSRRWPRARWPASPSS